MLTSTGYNFQVTESESLSVYELSVKCSSNTTSYLSVTLRDVVQNKALIAANSFCKDGNSVKKLSPPTIVKTNDSDFEVELKGRYLVWRFYFWDMIKLTLICISLVCSFIDFVLF